MFLPYFTSALLAGITAATPEQAPLSFTPESASANTLHVTHEAHPDHSLTITPHRIGGVNIQGEENRIASVCPGATDGYTGYLNKGDKQYVLGREATSTHPSFAAVF